MRTLIISLWILQALLQATVVTLMLRRKLHVRYPLFFSYMAYTLAENVVLYAVHDSYRSYFYAFWSMNAVALLLMLGIIYELFSEMFRQHHALRDFGTLLFRWAGVIVIMMAALLLYSSSIGTGSMAIVRAVLNVERSIRLMQGGMLLFLLLFSKQLGIRPKHQIFGIALGMGLFATVDLLLSSTFLRATVNQWTFNAVHMTAFNAMLITYVVYMLLPVPADVTPNLLLRPQRWNEALLDASHPDHGPVLMGIEDIVERTLKSSARKPPKSA